MRLTMTNRQLKALETKEKIYETALSLLESDGYDSIRIEDICQKAGVSIGTFYNYFKSKNEILQLIYQKGDEYFETKVREALSGSDAESAVVAYFKYYAEYNVKTGLVTLKHMYDAENEFFAKKRGMQDVLHEVILRGQEEKSLSKAYSADEIVSDLFILARGVTYDWCLKDGGYDLVEKTTSYIRRVIETYRI